MNLKTLERTTEAQRRRENRIDQALSAPDGWRFKLNQTAGFSRCLCASVVRGFA